jgi:5-methyltetrahydropteroyltriglutamate--homocysteine methyltransferase
VRVDYGAWWNYIFTRLGGLTMTDTDRWANAEVVRSTPGNIKLTNFPDRRDRDDLQRCLRRPGVRHLRRQARAVGNPEFTGPVTYIGQDQVDTDVNLLTKAWTRSAMTARTPSSPPSPPVPPPGCSNKYYDTEDELLDACCPCSAQEYKAITDAGFTVQIDAPDLAEAWDQINPEPSIADYQAWIRQAHRRHQPTLSPDIPKEQTRLHICWGSWHGPHTTDIPFEDIVDECLRANVGGLTFEGSSPRHAHEWRVWRDHKLPAGELIYPGVVCHSTNVVEHPRLVADRILQFAEVAGPENVIASTDCGLGGRLHPQIAWAKLESLVKGAEIASKELFG